jgi:hypothetical protein
LTPNIEQRAGATDDFLMEKAWISEMKITFPDEFAIDLDFSINNETLFDDVMMVFKYARARFHLY